MEGFVNRCPALLAFCSFRNADAVRAAGLVDLGKFEFLQLVDLHNGSQGLLRRFPFLSGLWRETSHPLASVLSDLRRVSVLFLEYSNGLLLNADALISKQLFQVAAAEDMAASLDDMIGPPDTGSDDEEEAALEAADDHLNGDHHLVQQVVHNFEDPGHLGTGNDFRDLTVRRRQSPGGRVYRRTGRVASSARVKALNSLLVLVLQLHANKESDRAALDVLVENYCACRSKRTGTTARSVSVLDVVALAILMVTVSESTWISNLCTTGVLAMQNVRVKAGLGGDHGNGQPAVHMGSPSSWAKAAASRVLLCHLARAYCVLTAEDRASTRLGICRRIGSGYGMMLACQLSGIVRRHMWTVWSAVPEVWLSHDEGHVNWLIMVGDNLKFVSSEDYQSIQLAVLAMLDEAITHMAAAIVGGLEALAQFKAMDETSLLSCISVRGGATGDRNDKRLECSLGAYTVLQESLQAATTCKFGAQVQHLLQAFSWLSTGPLTRPADSTGFVEEGMFVRVVLGGVVAFCTVPVHKEQAAVSNVTVVLHPSALLRILAARLFVRKAARFDQHHMCTHQHLDLILAKACMMAGLEFELSANLLRKVRTV